MITARVTRQLPFEAADIAKPLANLEIWVATILTWWFTQGSAQKACATCGGHVVKRTTHVAAETPRRGLCRIRRAACAAIGSTAVEAAMGAYIAGAADTHLLHVIGVWRIDLAVICPLYRTCFRPIATHLTSAAAGLHADIRLYIAAQAVVACN
jgi:hypothetical protein